MSETKTDALVVYQEQPKPDALAVGQEHSLDICPVTSPKEREAHGQALAAKFINGVAKVAVQFIRELEPEIRQVRKDFLDKPKKELICGVRTFTEYCTAVLGYSIRHIDRILEGHNPSLTLAENKAASHRKAKRELEAKTKRAQAALPIRCKTNAEILADKKEETKAASLQQRVVTLQQELQTARQATVSASDIATAKDLQAIHAAEVKGLETEIKKLKASNQKLTTAYMKLRKDAVTLATAIRQANNVPAGIAARAAVFLQKHGEVETIGGAA